MENNFKGTTGKMISKELYGNFLVIQEKTRNVVNFNNKENSELIADAFNVRQQIDCDLPELLEQRNEMLAFINSFISDFEGDYVMPNGDIVDDPINLLVVNYEIAKSLIKKPTK